MLHDGSARMCCIRVRPQTGDANLRRLRWGPAYVDEGMEAYEKRYQQKRIKSLKDKAKDLGFKLMPMTL